MESANLSGVLNGAAAELESPIETPIPRAPQTTLHGYMAQLETLLGRRWDEGDVMRTMARLTTISVGGVSLEDVVGNELLYLREDTQEPEKLAVTLLGYYRLYHAAWPVATEVHSVPVPVWATEKEMEIEMGDYNSNSWDMDLEIEDDLEEEDDDICCVCLEDLYKGTVAALDCQHEFHLECITSWLVRGRNVCPLCRATAIRH